MMDEFFEITRYNLGSIPVEREQVDAVMLAEQVADELLPAASGRGVSIAIHAPDRPADSFIDLYKMARVLGDILKNAVALSSQRMGGDITAMSESGQYGVHNPDSLL